MIDRPVLLGVHVPKSGGTSIRLALEAAFGGGFYADYADDPALPDSQRQLDPYRHFRGRALPAGFACVYGHYHIGKYGQARAIRFTLLRHPVDTMISLYCYWKANTSSGLHHKYFLDQDLSVTELARMPIFRRLLSQTYFGNIDMKRFNLIGRHDRRVESLAMLSNLCGRPVNSTIHANATPGAAAGRLRQDPRLVAELTDILTTDIRFYERWAYRDIGRSDDN